MTPGKYNTVFLNWATAAVILMALRRQSLISSTFTELNRAFIDLCQRDYNISIKAFQEPSQSMNMNILKQLPCCRLLKLCIFLPSLSKQTNSLKGSNRNASWENSGAKEKALIKVVVGGGVYCLGDCFHQTKHSQIAAISRFPSYVEIINRRKSKSLDAYYNLIKNC